MRRFVFLGLVLVSLGACANNPVPTPPPPPPATAQVSAATATRPATRAAANATRPGAPATSAPGSAGADLCPFTGLPLMGMDLGIRRPLLIKIGNSPPERPQSGLQQADLVIEHLTEGAITRFSAVYYCADAASIGPIRSARLIDLELVTMFGAIFAHVGGSEPVRQMIAASEIAQADFDDYGRAPIFREIPERKRPFNRYTSTQEMYERAVDENLVPGPAVPVLAFDARAPGGGRAAARVTIPYRQNLSDAVFTYAAGQNNYVRSTGTLPHLDGVTNQPLTARNVLVLYAPHETTNIVEDSLGSRSVKITLTGTGTATLLRDGQAYDVNWTRSDPHAFFQLTGANGTPVPFQVGNTWIEVVPVGMQVKVE